MPVGMSVPQVRIENLTEEKVATTIPSLLPQFKNEAEQAMAHQPA
jgi:hypothetical protein